MKRFVLKKASLIGIIILTILLSAGSVIGAFEYHGVFTVTSFITNPDGGIRYFTVKETIPNCTKSTGTFWPDANEVTLDGSKAALAVVMSAKSINKKVFVYYTNYDSYCRYDGVGFAAD